MEGIVYIVYTIGMIRGHDKGRRLGGVEGDRPQFRKRGKGKERKRKRGSLDRVLFLTISYPAKFAL